MNHRVSVCFLAAATAAAAAVAAVAATGNGGTAADAATTVQPTPITLAGKVILSAGTASTSVFLAPPKCPAHQSFVATALSGSPDPTARFANGVYQASVTPSWGVSVPLAQKLSDGTVRRSLLTFAIAGPMGNTREGPLHGDTQLPGGVPVVMQHGAVPVTVSIFAQSGHADITFDVALTGQCAAETKLPTNHP